VIPIRGLWKAGALRTTRIEAFSDGVFAIVCTLLVLNLGVPHVTGPDTAKALADLLLDLRPKLACYVMSFVIIIIYWVSHYQFFHAIKKSDRGLLWLNSLFLMCLAFIPFPTALVGEYPREPLAVMFFAGTMAATGAGFTLMRWYASYPGGLVDPGLDRGLVRLAMFRSLMNPLLYGLVLLLAPAHEGVALGLCWAIPFLFFIPSRLERSAR